MHVDASPTHDALDRRLDLRVDRVSQRRSAAAKARAACSSTNCVGKVVRGRRRPSARGIVDHFTLTRVDRERGRLLVPPRRAMQ